MQQGQHTPRQSSIYILGRILGSLFGAGEFLALSLLQLAQDQFTNMVGFIN
jgi:hypothetical protein